eukprot:scaffold145407_cov66-Attheya_sp.AAC.2
MSSQKRKALSYEQTRTILLLIEFLSIPLTSIDFKSFCQDNKQVFGEPYRKDNTTPGSRLRRDCQKLFGRLKNKTISEYAAFLDRHNVPLSSCTTELKMTSHDEDNAKKNAPPSFREKTDDFDIDEYDSDDSNSEFESDDSKLEPPLLERRTTPIRRHQTRSSTGASTDTEDINFNGLAVTKRTVSGSTPDRPPRKRTPSRSRDSSTHNRSNTIVIRHSKSRTPGRRNRDTHYWVIPPPEESPNGTA